MMRRSTVAKDSDEENKCFWKTKKDFNITTLAPCVYRLLIAIATVPSRILAGTRARHAERLLAAIAAAEIAAI